MTDLNFQSEISIENVILSENFNNKLSSVNSIIQESYMELLAERITQSVNDLALQIDQLYKLTERDRESFLNKIQIFKTNLFALKSNLKISNKELIESHYKTTRSEIIEMKRVLDAKLEEIKFKNANQQNRAIQQNRLNIYSKNRTRNGSISKNDDQLFDTSLVSQSSQHGGKFGVMRHINKKQYEQLMKNIVQQTQKNSQLTEQLQKMREENDLLKKQKKNLEQKVDIYEPQKQLSERQLNQLKLKLSLLENKLEEKQLELSLLKDKDSENINQYNRSFIEITQLKNELDVAHQKIIKFSNIQQVNLYKIAALEQDLLKYKTETMALHQQYERRELELQRKISSLQQYEYSYNQILTKVAKIQHQLQNQREDIQVLQSELTKSQKLYYELKIQKENLQTYWELQKRMETQKNNQIQLLKDKLVQTQRATSIKQSEIEKIKQNITNYRHLYETEKQSRISLEETLLELDSKFQKQRQSYVCEIELKKIQIGKLSDQVKNSLELTRTLQEEINQSHMNRTKIREDSKLLANDLKDYQIKNIQLKQDYQEIKSILHQTVENLHTKEEQLESARKLIALLQNELKEAKVRLHRAKIEAIHDIRNTLF